MTWRTCPVDGSGFETWTEFTRHIYEQHTEGSSEARQMAVQRILAEGPGVREHMIVPKVTADPLTHALYSLAHNDPARARELIGSLGPAERKAYLSLLTQLINMLWSDA